MTIEQESGIVEASQAKLSVQFQIEQIRALIASTTARLQEYEDAIWQVIRSRYIDNATGVQLDILGRIVDLGRGAYDRDATNDDDYRAAIVIRIAALRSRGRMPDLENLLALLVDLMGGDWNLDERAPARLRLTLYDIGYDPNLVIAVIVRAKLCGVAIQVFASGRPRSEIFRYSAQATATPGTGRGWGFGHWVSQYW